MIREVIVTSPHGVRLAFEATGIKGLGVYQRPSIPGMVAVLDQDKNADVGLVPNSWLIELNDKVS